MSENYPIDDEIFAALNHRDAAVKTVLAGFDGMSREEIVTRLLSWMSVEAVDQLVRLIESDSE